MIHGGNTSIGFSLVETTVQGKIPIPSGKYVIQVVEDTEVVSKRSVELMPDLKLENIDNNSAPPNSFKTNIKLRNDGTLPVHIDEINVSGVPEPASQNELSFNRPGSNSMKIRSTVGSNKTATFNLEGYPFALGTRQDMYNYTVGNSSSRKTAQRDSLAIIMTDSPAVHVIPSKNDSAHSTTSPTCRMHTTFDNDYFMLSAQMVQRGNRMA